MLLSLSSFSCLFFLLVAAAPPSTAIKEAFEKLTVHPPPDHELVCNGVAKRVLLSPDQIRMWFKHLHTVKENRKMGAAREAMGVNVDLRASEGFKK